MLLSALTPYLCTALLLTPTALAAAAENEKDKEISSESQTQREDVCASLGQAQKILDTLQPPPNAHLEKKIGSSVGPFGSRWGESLGWSHEGPLSTALRLLPRVLNTLFSPSTLLGSKQSSKDGKARDKTGTGRKARIEEMLRLVDEAEQAGCADVWGWRGSLYMFPPKGIPQDLQAAYEAYDRYLAYSSDPAAQFFVGFFHATGLGGADQDQGKALLHYTFAALQGYRPAEMALGYRHWAGIGVQEDCLTALDFYQSAAEKSYATFLAGPPGGLTLPLTATRLSDRVGGIYGPHASWASTGAQSHRAAIKASSANARGETEREVLEYYAYHSDRDAHGYTVRLGRLLYLGSVYFLPGGLASGAEGVGEIPQSYTKAREYFLKVARNVWPTDMDSKGNVAPRRKMSKEAEDAIREPAMWAAGFLGRMALRGEGGKADIGKARMWLERAADFGDREALNGLGIIYRDGLNVPKDSTRAFHYFQAAAGQDLAEAQVNLAKLHIERGEVTQAIQYLEAALRNGSPFEAFHLLSSIHAQSARGGRPGTCGATVAWYKLVSERGSWNDNFMLDADRAWARGEEGKALLGWWIASEMGIEGGMNNVAFLLDQGRGRDKGWLEDDTARVAEMVNWVRSAGQDNVDAMVKVGDLFYEGHGVPFPGETESDAARAASYYQTAADTQSSALAYWNLGHMYEHGKGVPRDWHLAKRYYDLSGEIGGDGWLGIAASLVGLYLRSWWVEFRTNGEVPGLSIFEPDPDTLMLPNLGLWERVKSLFTPYPMDFGDDGAGGGEGDPETFDDFSGSGWVGEGDGEGEEGDLGSETVGVLLVGIGIAGLFWIRGRWVREGEERRRREDMERFRVLQEAAEAARRERERDRYQEGGRERYGEWEGGIQRDRSELEQELNRTRDEDGQVPTYIS
ncbi:hypothetical protein BCR39DRAFT_529970 [Naematelia encephala]|uniref:HCP-like protein n=1 Tax=Naematelia encephala TaxID=71784 RepID=A0A1Y2B651_9TREE|nr:hypothetical protein BCR39DRAFT_529970 [Naematelia encephala]